MLVQYFKNVVQCALLYVNFDVNLFYNILFCYKLSFVSDSLYVDSTCI